MRVDAGKTHLFRKQLILLFTLVLTLTFVSCLDESPSDTDALEVTVPASTQMPDALEPTIPAFARTFDGPASSCKSSEGWETKYREGEPGYYLYDASFRKHFIQWVPNSSRIVFGSEEAVWTIEASGGEPSLVVDANPGLRPLGYHGLRFGFHADVSPDGARIIYATCQFLADTPEIVESRIEKYGLDRHDAARNHYEIATASMDGRDVQRLTENEKIDHFPVWSPDGNRIAFIAKSYRSPGEPLRCNGEQLYTMMPDGSDIRWITKTLAFESIVLDEDGYKDEKSVVDIALSPPQWSPDGRHLAFVVNEGDCRVRSRALYTVREDGSNVKRISKILYRDGNPVTPPVWSPDGERIAFVDGDNRETGVYSVRSDGTDLKELWIDRISGSRPPVHQLSWSPDGTEVVFVSTDMWIVRADGTDLRKLASDSGVVVWSPDGERIAVFVPGADEPYESRERELGRLYTMNRDGTGIMVLLE